MKYPLNKIQLLSTVYFIFFFIDNKNCAENTSEWLFFKLVSSCKSYTLFITFIGHIQNVCVYLNTIFLGVYTCHNKIKQYNIKNTHWRMIPSENKAFLPGNVIITYKCYVSDFYTYNYQNAFKPCIDYLSK